MIPRHFICTIFIIVLGAKLSECCTFPTELQDGTWHSSDMGNVTFSSTSFVASSVVFFGSLTFNCQSNTGAQYYSLSETFSYLSNNFQVAICFNLYRQSSTYYTFYPLSTTLANTNISRLIFQSSGYSFTQAETCSLSTSDPSQLRVLVKEGFINVSSGYCNNNILGNYEYNVTGSMCNETDLVTCTDYSTLTYNYTTCATTMLFSAGGVLNCVAYASANSVEYAIVYNQDTSVDESTYYRYTCIASTVSNGVTYISAYPQACPDTMNSTYAPSPGVSYTMTASTTCPINDDDDDNVLSAGAATAIVLALIVIIGAIAVVGGLYYVKVHKKKKINPGKEVIAAKSPPLDTNEQRNHDGRVSPFSPYPTVSELAVYRFGPSPADGIDDDDGGFTLDATTPGFTEGRRTIFDKDVERESQDSLPLYSEVGGETPDPTRLSEVNTRMSEVSEANIADPTPWTMTRATMNIPEETSVSPIQSEAGKVQTPREANDVTL